MEGNESTAKPWSSTQVYGLAVICLIVGICIGYLIHTPFQSSTVNPPVTQPPVAPSSDMKITPDQLNQMADKQVEPLLAQLRKSPDDPLLLAEISKIYYQTRQFPKAVMYYEDSVRVKPDASVFVKLGGAYHLNGDEDKAIGAWNRALRLDPKNADALFNIGFVKWQVQGDPKAAIAAWQKLLEMNPNHPGRAQVEELLAQAKQHPKAPIAGKK
jgi:cytochrome c-type biogenesis protein CcmH/NrfG